MANVQYYDVIIKPVITEQSMNAMAQKTYTFYVHTDANKSMLRVFTLATLTPSNIFSTASLIIALLASG